MASHNDTASLRDGLSHFEAEEERSITDTIQSPSPTAPAASPIDLTDLPPDLIRHILSFAISPSTVTGLSILSVSRSFWDLGCTFWFAEIRLSSLHHIRAFVTSLLTASADKKRKLHCVKEIVVTVASFNNYYEFFSISLFSLGRPLVELLPNLQLLRLNEPHHSPNVDYRIRQFTRELASVAKCLVFDGMGDRLTAVTGRICRVDTVVMNQSSAMEVLLGLTGGGACGRLIGVRRLVLVAQDGTGTAEGLFEIKDGRLWKALCYEAQKNRFYPQLEEIVVLASRSRCAIVEEEWDRSLRRKTARESSVELRTLESWLVKNEGLREWEIDDVRRLDRLL